MTVVYINAVQYQTCPNHESDNHFFAKIPGGVRTPGPPPLDPPLKCDHILNGSLSRNIY